MSYEVKLSSPADIIKNYQVVVNKVLSRIKFPPSCRDDLVQEGNIALLKAFMSYDPSKGVPFSDYAFIVVRNRVLNFLRKEKKLEVPAVFNLNDCETVDAFELIPSSALSPEDAMVIAEFKDKLTQFVKTSLTDEEKSVLSLYFDGMSYREISLKLGIRIKRVDNVLLKVKRKLKNFLDIDADLMKLADELKVLLPDIIRDLNGENT